MAVANSGGIVAEEQGWAASDLDALRLLYPQLRRFAAVIGQWDVDPDDLVQEAYARVMRTAPSRIDDLAPYLRRAIANLATDVRRRRTREREALARSAAAVDEADQYPSDLADLLRLAPSLRGLLYLVEVEGHQVADAAKTVGMSPSAARVALMRARRRLRAELDSEYADE
jgi:RNA polymerase sigma factor (sigma-70 family)